MKKIILFILLLIFNNGFAQTAVAKKLSTNEVLKLSKTYQNKALKFLEIPQYNQDSSAYYFQKACTLLQTNPSLFYEELGTLYLQQIDVTQVYNSYDSMDSLALVGWNYINKMPKNKQNKVLEYNFLANWAFIKEEIGENKIALKLISKALKVTPDFKDPDMLIKVIKDKGIFYQKCNLQ